jgi:hypothetical protein
MGNCLGWSGRGLSMQVYAAGRVTAGPFSKELGLKSLRGE